MSNVIVGSTYKTRSYLDFKSIKVIDTKIVSPNLIATVEDQKSGECFEVTGSELLADYQLTALPKIYTDVQKLNQSECYKQRVIELNKAKPDQVVLKLLESRIAKFDADNKSQEAKVFTGTFGKPEPMQNCVAK